MLSDSSDDELVPTYIDDKFNYYTISDIRRIYPDLFISDQESDDEFLDRHNITKPHYRYIKMIDDVTGKFKFVDEDKEGIEEGELVITTVWLITYRGA